VTGPAIRPKTSVMHCTKGRRCGPSRFYRRSQISGLGLVGGPEGPTGEAGWLTMHRSRTTRTASSTALRLFDIPVLPSRLPALPQVRLSRTSGLCLVGGPEGPTGEARKLNPAVVKNLLHSRQDQEGWMSPCCLNRAASRRSRFFAERNAVRCFSPRLSVSNSSGTAFRSTRMIRTTLATAVIALRLTESCR
jgi:hypothetical protein